MAQINLLDAILVNGIRRVLRQSNALAEFHASIKERDKQDSARGGRVGHREETVVELVSKQIDNHPKCLLSEVVGMAAVAEETRGEESFADLARRVRCSVE